MSDLRDFIAPGRRIVTGVNKEGKSTIVSDGNIPDSALVSFEKIKGGELWMEKDIPVNNRENKDTLEGEEIQDWPEPGGMIARMGTWEAGLEYPMHKSNTLDLIWVIFGKLELILEEESTVLYPGDTCVQRGTMHGWKVLGDSQCTFVAVLLDADPLD